MKCQGGTPASHSSGEHSEFKKVVIFKKDTDGLVWCQIDVCFEYSMMAFII